MSNEKVPEAEPQQRAKNPLAEMLRRLQQFGVKEQPTRHPKMVAKKNRDKKKAKRHMSTASRRRNR